MDQQPRKILLSEVLNDRERFNFEIEGWMKQLRKEEARKGDIQELVEGASTNLRGLVEYLMHLRETFVQLKTYNIRQDDWKWFYEGRGGVGAECEVLKQVDDYLNEVVSVLETDDDASNSSVISLVERVSDLMLEVKAHLYHYRKKVEIATSFKEINESIITSLKLEMESCIHKLVSLRNTTRENSDEKVEFKMEDITEKMKINDMSFSHSMSMKSLRLPTFTESDNAVYEEYLAIESRIRPLEFSLDVLPQKIEEFSNSCYTYFPKAVEQLNKNFDSLKSKWELVQNALTKVKKEVIDTRWHEIFVFLISNLAKKCHRLITSLEIDGQITDSIGMSYKFISNCITMINKAFNEELIYTAEVHDLFYNNLHPEWETLNNMISSSPSSSNNGTPKRNSRTDMNGLRVFHTAKRPSERVSSMSGFDLGLNVENMHAPFSIQKRDRVKDFLANDVELKKTNVKRALQHLNEADNDYDNDDELTLVNKTPNLKASVDNIDIKGLKITNHMKSEALLHSLAIKPCNTPSKIPILREDYMSIGAPQVPLRKFQDAKPSRIPRYINKSKPTERPKSEGSLLDPPPFLMPPLSSQSSKGSNDDDVFRKPSGPPISARSRNSSISSVRRVSLLSETGTPNLTMRKNSYNSTSPERPSSSIGNRYDAEHLVQPLEASKPGWK